MKKCLSLHLTSFKEMSQNILTLVFQYTDQHRIFFKKTQCVYLFILACPKKWFSTYCQSSIALREGAGKLIHTTTQVQHKYIPNQRKQFYLSKYSAYTTGSGKICSKNSSPSSPFDLKYSQRTRQYKAISGVNVSAGINFLHLKGRQNIS